MTISSGSFNVPCSESCSVAVAMTEAERFGELVWNVLKRLVLLVADSRPGGAAPAGPARHRLGAERSENTSKLKSKELQTRVVVFFVGVRKFQ